MDILVSFCNVQTPGRPLLALLDTASPGLRVVRLPASVGTTRGITGTAINDEYLFALAQQPAGADGPTTTGSSSLLVLDRANLQFVRQHPLHGLSDVRSIAILDDALYVTSTGTDELIELRMRGPEIA